jgi:hypothetical protein
VPNITLPKIYPVLACYPALGTSEVVPFPEKTTLPWSVTEVCEHFPKHRICASVVWLEQLGAACCDSLALLCCLGSFLESAINIVALSGLACPRRTPKTTKDTIFHSSCFMECVIKGTPFISSWVSSVESFSIGLSTCRWIHAVAEMRGGTVQVGVAMCWYTFCCCCAERGASAS